MIKKNGREKKRKAGNRSGMDHPMAESIWIGVQIGRPRGG